MAFLVSVVARLDGEQEEFQAEFATLAGAQAYLTGERRRLGIRFVNGVICSLPEDCDCDEQDVIGIRVA